ncbi:hypothetical protein [Arthrobacter castelli]|uniref:hypothetical protein n=1 Tax=Arthrobacter castelli TaxID=271431 RepID=UPI00040AF0CA|nr:hypothetical protein [Arthrobacter castelli]
MNEPEVQPHGTAPAEEPEHVPGIPRRATDERGVDDTLTITAAGIQLPDPELAEPVISPEVASEVSLAEVAAVTEAVERQAEKAGTLAGGPSVKPADKDDVGHKIETSAPKAPQEATDGPTTDTETTDEQEP